MNEKNAWTHPGCCGFTFYCFSPSGRLVSKRIAFKFSHGHHCFMVTKTLQELSGFMLSVRYDLITLYSGPRKPGWYDSGGYKSGPALAIWFVVVKLNGLCCTEHLAIVNASEIAVVKTEEALFVKFRSCRSCREKQEVYNDLFATTFGVAEESGMETVLRYSISPIHIPK